MSGTRLEPLERGTTFPRTRPEAGPDGSEEAVVVELPDQFECDVLDVVQR